MVPAKLVIMAMVVVRVRAVDVCGTGTVRVRVLTLVRVIQLVLLARVMVVVSVLREQHHTAEDPKFIDTSYARGKAPLGQRAHRFRANRCPFVGVSCCAGSSRRGEGNGSSRPRRRCRSLLSTRLFNFFAPRICVTVVKWVRVFHFVRRMVLALKTFLWVTGTLSRGAQQQPPGPGAHPEQLEKIS